MNEREKTATPRTVNTRSLGFTEIRRQIAETQMSKCGGVQKEPSKVD